MNKDEIAGLRGLSDDALQKVSNAFDYGETLNVASMRQIVEILADEMEVIISQPDCDGDFEGDVWFGHPEKRTLGTHIWRAGLWHELPTELDAVISLLGQARSQRDANADALTTLSARVETLETALVAEREDNLWNAYNTGHVKDDRWSHMFMSDGEWLAVECGFDCNLADFDDAAIRAAIPVAARKAIGGGNG